MLGRALGAGPILGTDVSPSRLALASNLGLIDHAIESNDATLSRVLEQTGGRGCEATIDCSGAPAARLLALRATRAWGRCVFVGEGNTVEFDVSKELIHKQITLFGSWVTSVGHMAELVERLDRWGLHPDRICTHRLPLDRADEAYRAAAAGQGGKVCIVFDDEAG
jgi:threonine dehydrogenase-like Zn-dependent dehydrogenase